MSRVVAAAVVAAVLAALAPFAAAQAPQQMLVPLGAGPLVDLAAEASREVPNDLMTATMVVEANDASAAALASLLNRTTAEALRVAGEFRDVRARSGGSQTYPVYDRTNKQTGWRGRSEVRLESRDFKQTAELIARLQGGMQLQGVSFSVSPELRRQTENELVVEAVAAFRARADIAARALGTRGYRIRRLAINTAGAFPQPRAMARAAPASADAFSAPVFEGGTSQVQVSAQGVVEVE